mmetsp:Transcript_89902/g.290418  ORF Transcript_89902/g.290418 Transcript_89902/m.290418 type:complete len:256 (+) Transcript_89902:194-961(+)
MNPLDTQEDHANKAPEDNQDALHTRTVPSKRVADGAIEQGVAGRHHVSTSGNGDEDWDDRSPQRIRSLNRPLEAKALGIRVHSQKEPARSEEQPDAELHHRLPNTKEACRLPAQAQKIVYHQGVGQEFHDIEAVPLAQHVEHIHDGQVVFDGLLGRISPSARDEPCATLRQSHEHGADVEQWEHAEPPPQLRHFSLPELPRCVQLPRRRRLLLELGIQWPCLGLSLCIVHGACRREVLGRSAEMLRMSNASAKMA